MRVEGPSFRAVSPTGVVAPDYDQLRDERDELAVRVDELLDELAEVKDRNSRLVNTIAAMRTQLARAEQARDTAKLAQNRGQL